MSELETMIKSESKATKTKDVNLKPKKPKKEKKPNKIVKSLKETGSELKKVTWPTFGKVIKQTGVVLAVVVLFTVVLFGIDRLLTWLYTLIINILA